MNTTTCVPELWFLGAPLKRGEVGRVLAEARATENRTRDLRILRRARAEHFRTAHATNSARWRN